MEKTRAERRAAGRALRDSAPRSAHGDWQPAAARRDPIDILVEQGDGRVAELLPIRYQRMTASPFGFLRGAAAVMAHDLATAPSSGLTVQACGDAHVSNFGEFATPERNIVFGLNDFDETLPAPWEWDVKRLAASLQVVADQSGFTTVQQSAVVTTAVRAYRERMQSYADFRVLDLWHSRIDIAQVISHFPVEYRPTIARDVAKARRRNSRTAAAKLTQLISGRRRFIDDPPLLVRLKDTGHEMTEVLDVVDRYRRSLSHDRRVLFDRFRLIDVARKVVGVGSVGTDCWVALFEGPDHPGGDPLVLQVKQAVPSVLERHIGKSTLDHHGLRVVAGQRLIQAASDIFLGWTEAPGSGRHYYVRQLWDGKGQEDPTLMNSNNLAYYGALCAWALARAHARSGDPVAISGYLGTGPNFDNAVANFAATYARQTRADHAALLAAMADERLGGSRGRR